MSKIYKTKEELQDAKDQLIEEFRMKMYIKQWEKDNFIEMNEYLPYSGEVEETKFTETMYMQPWYFKDKNYNNIKSRYKYGKFNKNDDEQ